MLETTKGKQAMYLEILWPCRHVFCLYSPESYTTQYFQKTIESEEWFSGRIPRNQAERLVLCNDLPLGTFLIRERECDVLEYALTIRDYDDGLRLPCVKHYKIKALDNGAGFYITTRVKFPSLPELVSYYSGYVF